MHGLKFFQLSEKSGIFFHVHLLVEESVFMVRTYQQDLVTSPPAWKQIEIQRATYRNAMWKHVTSSSKLRMDTHFWSILKCLKGIFNKRQWMLFFKCNFYTISLFISHYTHYIINHNLIWNKKFTDLY